MTLFQSVWLHRVRRLSASASPVLFTGSMALAGLVIAGISKNISLPLGLIEGLLFLSIALLALQTYAEYRRRTYDATLVLKFVEKFDGDGMKHTRSRAAKFLKENKEQLADEACFSQDIDDLFDFFDDLGFFMTGDQITPESVHHAFYPWIRGYYHAAHKYLMAAEEERPAAWQHVQMLFNMTNQIERAKIRDEDRRRWDEKNAEDFLTKEIALKSGPDGPPGAEAK